MTKKLLLGIDGGGTYTRIAITDLEGNLITYLEKAGSASIYKDKHAKHNVQTAIEDALRQSGHDADEVACIVAGIAGYDDEQDLAWVQELARVSGLDCTCHYLNDAVIAALGAFAAEPGIIAIAGTGCIAFGLTESGQHIRNYDFGYYIPAHARGLAYHAVGQIIAGETDASDAELLSKTFAYFQVADASSLARLGAKRFLLGDQARDKLFGEFAPTLTAQALAGSNLAQKICKENAHNLITAIKMLGACFDSDQVSVALVGSVINSPYMHEIFSSALRQPSNKKYDLRSPALPAVLGAITKAMELKNISINDNTLSNLRYSAKQIQAYSKM